MSIREVYNRRDISKRGQESRSLRMKPIAAQKKMIGGFIASDAYKCGIGAVDEIVIIAVGTKIA